SQVATIGRKPVKPTNFRARFNNWNDGHVSWEPEQKNATFLHTATTVSYSFLHPSSGGLTPCTSEDKEHKSNCICSSNHCNFTHISARLYLYLQIDCINDIGKTTARERIDMEANMVPYAVNK
ncbi:unnamed protein product, partial [Owenia fusiformis]